LHLWASTGERTGTFGIVLFPGVEELDATTHWASLGRLRALGDVEVVEERFTRDGAIWTAAGIASGIDLTLQFIAETAGDDVAGMVQLEAEYFPSATIYGTAASSGKGAAYFRTS
jgi:transcriptional regulator GlxA family with amidase domain